MAKTLNDLDPVMSSSPGLVTTKIIKLSKLKYQIASKANNTYINECKYTGIPMHVYTTWCHALVFNSVEKSQKKQLYSLKIELFARECKYFLILLLDKLVSRQDLYWTIIFWIGTLFRKIDRKITFHLVTRRVVFGQVIFL